MYNANVKEQFIETLNSSEAKVATYAFNQLESLETTSKDDAYNIPYDILITEVVRNGNTSNLSSVRNKYSIFQRYKKWALLNHYIDAESEYTVFESCDIKSIFIKHNNINIFYSEDELYKYLSDNLTINLHEKDITQIDLVAASYLLAFNGIHPDDIMTIKKDEVIVKEKSTAVLYNDEIVLLGKKTKKIVDKIRNGKFFISNTPSRRGEFEMNSDLLIDNGSNSDSKRMRALISQSSSKKLNGLKIKDVYYISLIVKFKQAMDCGDAIPFKQLYNFCYGKKKLGASQKEYVNRLYELI